MQKPSHRLTTSWLCFWWGWQEPSFKSILFFSSFHLKLIYYIWSSVNLIFFFFVFWHDRFAWCFPYNVQLFLWFLSVYLIFSWLSDFLLFIWFSSDYLSIWCSSVDLIFMCSSLLHLSIYCSVHLILMRLSDFLFICPSAFPLFLLCSLLVHLMFIC